LISRGNRIKRSFSPFYLAILSGVLLIILIINGILEVKRTKDGFYLLLEREANVLLQHYEKNIQDTFATLQLFEKPPPDFPPPLFGSLFGLEESIAEYLVDAANRIDQIDRDKTLAPKDLQSLVDQYLITSIEIYDPTGRLIKGWPPASPRFDRKPFLRELIEKRRSVVVDLFGKPLSGEDQWFSIAIWRKRSPGIISLRLDNSQMRMLIHQFAIQKAISDIGLREGILYVSVQDAQFNILAHTDPGPLAEGRGSFSEKLSPRLQTSFRLRQLPKKRMSLKGPNPSPSKGTPWVSSALGTLLKTSNLSFARSKRPLPSRSSSFSSWGSLPLP
jgi:hypothetical protein